MQDRETDVGLTGPGQQLIDEELSVQVHPTILTRQTNFPVLENPLKVKGKLQSKCQSPSIVKVIRRPTLYDIVVLLGVRVAEASTPFTF